MKLCAQYVVVMSAGKQKSADDYSRILWFFKMGNSVIFIYGVDSRLRGNDGVRAGMTKGARE